MLEEQGEAYLETWQVPMLTWDELQELKQLYEAAPIAALESPLGGEQHDSESAQHCLIASPSCRGTALQVPCGILHLQRDQSHRFVASVCSSCLSGRMCPICSTHTPGNVSAWDTPYAVSQGCCSCLL